MSCVGEKDGRDFGLYLNQSKEFVLNLRRHDDSSRARLVDGRTIPVIPFPQGTMSLVDHAIDQTGDRYSSREHVTLYVRRSTFDELADNHATNRISKLDIEAGVACDDSIVANLGACLRSAIERYDQKNFLYMDHVVQALHTRFAEQYGGMRFPQPIVRGGLAPWQLQLARNKMGTNLEDGIPLSEIAADCRLSLKYFARAFTRSLGVSPHRWLLQRRLSHAQNLMRTTEMSLAVVAITCGFSDQAHFTRVFSRAVGTTPGRWRRIQRS
jgi:AraC-like DNA-binding protein